MMIFSKERKMFGNFLWISQMSHGWQNYLLFFMGNNASLHARNLKKCGANMWWWPEILRFWCNANPYLLYLILFSISLYHFILNSCMLFPKWQLSLTRTQTHSLTHLLLNFFFFVRCYLLGFMICERLYDISLDSWR